MVAVRRVSLLVAILALAATSCGSSSPAAGPRRGDGPPSIGGVAVDRSAIRGPGTALGHGVEVQKGSSLIGPVFPMVNAFDNPGQPKGAVGWQAVLVVDGEPSAVWDRYATALDIEDLAPATKSCTVSRPRTPTPDAGPEVVEQKETVTRERSVTEPAIDGENLLRCHVSLGSIHMDLARGEQPCAVKDRNDRCTRYVSHLLIRVNQSAAPGANPSHQSFGTDELAYSRDRLAKTQAVPPGTPVSDIEPVAIPTGPIVPFRVTPPSSARPLPAVGSRYDDQLDNYLGREGIAVLPSQAKSLVAPALLIACNSGLVAVLRFRGGPANAVAWFDGASTDDDPIQTVSGSREGRAWIGGTITTAGGYYVDPIAVADDAAGTTSTVLVTECGD